MGAMIGRAAPPSANGGNGQAPPPNGQQPPAQNAAAGMDAQNQQLMATMQNIRALGEAVKQLAAENPMVADEANQIQQLLKQIVVKSASVAPVQTMSSEAVPMGGTA